jgi:hypothetical protein
VANSRRPSFLKRQKEQKRLAKALEKREARLARKRPQEIPLPEQAEALEPADQAEQPESSESPESAGPAPSEE